jgi:hypothetical protein
MNTPSPTYFLNNYGTCTAPACHCRMRGPWRGQGCPSWRPLSITSFVELFAYVKATHGVKKIEVMA